MKNTNKKAALAAMMCMAMAVPFGANAENETRVITAGTLNLRAGASTESEILGKYGWGTEVEVLTEMQKTQIRAQVSRMRVPCTLPLAKDEMDRRIRAVMEQQVPTSWERRRAK